MTPQLVAKLNRKHCNVCFFLFFFIKMCKNALVCFWFVFKNCAMFPQKQQLMQQLQELKEHCINWRNMICFLKYEEKMLCDAKRFWGRLNSRGLLLLLPGLNNKLLVAWFRGQLIFSFCHSVMRFLGWQMWQIIQKCCRIILRPFQKNCGQRYVKNVERVFGPKLYSVTYSCWLSEQRFSQLCYG